MNYLKMKIRFIQLLAKKRNGQIPIYCRVTIAGERWQFSTGIKARVNEFNPKKQQIRGNKSANLKMQTIKSKIEITYANLYLQGKTTIFHLKEELTPKTKYSIVSLLEEYHKENIKNVCSGTLKAYRAYFLNLSSFKMFKQITPEEFNQSIANRLIIFLTTKRKVKSSSYLKKQFSYLNRCFLFSLKKGYIKYNPIQNIVLPKSSFERRSPLSKNEVLKLFRGVSSQRLKKIQLLAFIQINTGLSYCDLMKFSKESIEKYQGELFLIDKRQKTDVEFCVPIDEKLSTILHSIDFKIPKISNSKYNKYLKELAKLQGINRKISTHDLRVTFTQLKIDDGFTIHTIAKMLGHVKIDTTLNYYGRLSKERVINEVLGQL